MLCLDWSVDADEIRQHVPMPDARSAKADHVQAVIVADAVMSARREPLRRISYSRRKGWWTDSSRYRGREFTYDSVAPAVDALIAAGVLVDHDLQPAGRATGIQSSYRPADWLAGILPPSRDMKAAAMHPGQMAKAQVMAAGPDPDEDPKTLNRRGDKAYREAMRAWQDLYFEAVGIHCGLTRLGPARRRLTRAEWQAEKTQAKALRASLDRANEVQTRVESFVARTKTETESLVASAATKAASLCADADAAKAESLRQMEAARAATAAALVAQDRAVADQRRARRMMKRIQLEGERVQKAAARIQRLPGLLRTLWDGFRASKIRDRILRSVDAEMSRLREQASAAAERASIFL